MGKRNRSWLRVTLDVSFFAKFFSVNADMPSGKHLLYWLSGGWEYLTVTNQKISGTLRALLEAAVRAPSSHNTQPWIFAPGENRISLRADRSRRLPVNDPEDREMAISCGAALFNLRVAAASAGLHASVSLLPERNNAELLATVDFCDGPSGPDTSIAELSAEIAKRRTHRKPFACLSVPESVGDQLTDAAKQEGAGLSMLSGESQRRQAADGVARGDAVQWADRAWRRELAAWMRAKKEGDGLGVPGFAVPVVKAVIRNFDMGKRIAAKDSRLALASPLLALLTTDGDKLADWLKAGQALERVLLTASRSGLQASYLNQPIQVAPLRAKLSRAARAAGHPQILLRLGFPARDLPATARRPLEDVVTA